MEKYSGYAMAYDEDANGADKECYGWQCEGKVCDVPRRKPLVLMGSG